MKFDLYSMPKRNRVNLTSISFMEASIKEEIKAMNVIYENVMGGNLTEDQAHTLIHCMANKDSIIDDANDILNQIDRRLPIIPHATFRGEKILPTAEILKADNGDSFYKPYTFDREFDASTRVGQAMAEYADYMCTELQKYKKTGGNEGFTESTRVDLAIHPKLSTQLPNFLCEAIESSAITGLISAEDGVVLKSFINNCFYEFNIGSMCPVILPHGATLVKSGPAMSTVDELIAKTNKKIRSEQDTEYTTESNGVRLRSYQEYLEVVASNLLRSSGWFTAMESTKIYKNNLIFDSISNTVFEKLSMYLRLPIPDNKVDSFKKCLNVKKNRYSFSFTKPEEVDTNKIKSIIIGCGFKPIKENNKILTYEKVSRGLTITVHFETPESGVVITYNLPEANSAVTESTEDQIALKMTPEQYLSELKKIKDKWKDIRSWSEKTWHNSLNPTNPLYGKELCDISKMKIELEQAYRSLSDEYCRTSKEQRGLSLIKAKSDQIVEEISKIKDSVDSKIRSSKVKPNFITQESMDDYLFEIITNNPTDAVANVAFDIMESVYNESVTMDQFKSILSDFAEQLELQTYSECACEVVLNNTDFMTKYMTESKEASKTDIDDDIKGTISLLNRLGYTTKYSCSGHDRTRIKEDGKRDGVYHGKLYTTARIVFDKKYKFDSIPDGWYQNHNADTTSIYVRPLTYSKGNGDPDEAFFKWKSGYMKSLRNWAENLNDNKSSYEENEKTVE